MLDTKVNKGKGCRKREDKNKRKLQTICLLCPVLGWKMSQVGVSLNFILYLFVCLLLWKLGMNLATDEVT